MLKKLLILTLLSGSAIVAATEHRPIKRAFEDQHGRPFHTDLKRHIDAGKGVPEVWPSSGSQYHHRNSDE